MRNVGWVSMPEPTIWPISSSKYGKCHWSGRSTTPSIEMKKFETILAMLCSLVCATTRFRQTPSLPESRSPAQVFRQDGPGVAGAAQVPSPVG